MQAILPHRVLDMHAHEDLQGTCCERLYTIVHCICSILIALCAYRPMSASTTCSNAGSERTPCFRAGQWLEWTLAM